MSPTVTMLRDRVAKSMPPAFAHLPASALNHAVVLLYRDANDRIGFHQDKTLDLAPDTPIVSVSLGQTRTYVLQDHPRTPRRRQEVTLRHGTLLVLGPAAAPLLRLDDPLPHSRCRIGIESSAQFLRLQRR